MENTKPEPIFADGLFFKRPREGAPTFVKGNISVNANVFIDFLKNNKQYESDKGWINFDLKESKSKALYVQLNTWKPTKQSNPHAENGDDDMNIPF